MAAALALVAGCSSAPGPQAPVPPPAVDAAPTSAQLIAGAADSVNSIPGSADALYIYRFKQIEPGSSSFTFRDRDLSFVFRPTPSALYFRVQNLQGRPVTIDWDKSNFVDPDGRGGKVAHNSSRWRNRFTPQAQSQVPAQTEYSDFTFPMDFLLDPGTAQTTEIDSQPRRALLTEDQTAVTNAGRIFGVDLAFLVEGQPRTYTFRFQVASVIPR
ncbi:MAG: hypothetical protein ABIU54_03810 [Candidatus Eisenbacteria bacterium]